MSNTYSFVDVSASIVGPTGNVNIGYGASTAKEGITIVRSKDINKMDIGADGGGQHSLSADKSGKIMVRLLKVAPGNALLMGMVDGQRLNSALWGQNTITIRQLVSNDISISSQCAFVKIPDLSYQEDGGLVEWSWDSIDIGTILGTY